MTNTMPMLTDEHREMLIDSCHHVIAEQPLSPFGAMAKIALAALTAERKAYDTTTKPYFEYAYTAPPVPAMKPVDLGNRFTPTLSAGLSPFAAMRMAADGNWLNRAETIMKIRAAGYEVKE